VQVPVRLPASTSSFASRSDVPMTMLHSIRLVMLAGVPLPTPVSRGATTDSALPTGSVLIALVASPVGIYVAGTAIAYLEHSCRFKAPVRAGDTVEARVTITDVMTEKNRVALKTVCSVGDTVVIDGEALVLVPPRP
jgi:3-hydroxybutyryl-CoA dehydratase